MDAIDAKSHGEWLWMARRIKIQADIVETWVRDRDAGMPPASSQLKGLARDLDELAELAKNFAYGNVPWDGPPPES